MDAPIEASSVCPGAAALLAEPVPAVVGTLRRSGAIKLTPVWFEHLDGLLWLNAHRGAHWLEQVERDRAATILVIDPEDPYCTVHAETRLVDAVTHGAADHLDRLSMRYLGRPYLFRAPIQRVIVRLAPEQVRYTPRRSAGRPARSAPGGLA